MRRIILALAACTIMAAITAPASAEWRRVIRPDGSGWRCTTQAVEDWAMLEAADSEAWSPVRVGTPAPYPEDVEPADQYRWPFIWSKEDMEATKAVYFRRTVNFDANVTAARLGVCAWGENLVVYLNGEKVLENPTMGQLHNIDLTDRLKPGANVIAAAVVRGEKNYGLLVMGEAEVQWPAKDYCLVSESSQRPALGADAWKSAEEALALDYEGTPYPAVQPPGGMAEYSTAHFMLPLSVDGSMPLAAALRIAGDDSYEVKVNGQVVAVEKRVSRAYVPVTVDVTKFIEAGGTNIITARVTNDWGPGRIHLRPTAMLLF
jgi:hypothetical protein